MFPTDLIHRDAATVIDLIPGLPGVPQRSHVSIPYGTAAFGIFGPPNLHVFGRIVHEDRDPREYVIVLGDDFVFPPLGEAGQGGGPGYTCAATQAQVRFWIVDVEQYAANEHA